MGELLSCGSVFHLTSSFLVGLDICSFVLCFFTSIWNWADSLGSYIGI